MNNPQERRRNSLLATVFDEPREVMQKHRWLWWVLLCLIVLVGYVGYRAPQADYIVFWQGGHNFAAGESLYVTQDIVKESSWNPADRDFIYPPFAAMCFQLLALVPFNESALCFAVFNFLVTIYAVLLARSLAMKLFPQGNHALWVQLAAILFSLRVLINNLKWLQMNAVWFALALTGIYFAVNRKEFRAAGFLVAATFIKLIPVLCLLWFVVRGRFRATLAVAVFSFAALALPMLARGPQQGITDLKEYYQSFLSEFVKGKVVDSYGSNNNLASTIWRATVGSETNDDLLDFVLVPLTPERAKQVCRWATLGVGAMLLGLLLYQRLRQAPISIFEICFVLTTGHLVSGVTWKHHLVTMVLPLMAFFSIPIKKLQPPIAVIVGVYWAAVVVFSCGNDLIPRGLVHVLRSSSFIGWFLVMTWGLSAYFALFEIDPEQRRRVS
jgi:hypothetical protein